MVKSCFKNCPPECHNVEFDLTVVQSSYPSTYYSTLLLGQYSHLPNQPAHTQLYEWRRDQANLAGRERLLRGHYVPCGESTAGHGRRATGRVHRLVHWSVLGRQLSQLRRALRAGLQDRSHRYRRGQNQTTQQEIAEHSLSFFILFIIL